MTRNVFLKKYVIYNYIIKYRLFNILNSKQAFEI